MRIELGAPIVIIDVEISRGDLYHLPAPKDRPGPERTALCGLEGPTFAYDGFARRRRLCAVCRTRAPQGHYTAAGEYVEPLPVRRKPAGKPPLVHSRLKPEHLRVLYEAKYVGEGMGTFRIGELIWRRLGFRSAKSAGQAVYVGFRQMGFELRSQSEGTALKNYKHGRRTRSVSVEHGTGGYRRWLKEQRGAYQPCCAGANRRTGKPCTRPAMRDSEFCSSHEPSRLNATATRLADMRSRSPMHDPSRLEPLAPLQEELRALYKQLGPGTWKELAPLTGMTPANLCRIARTRQQTRIAIDKAAAIRRAMATLTAPELARAA